MRLLDAQFRYVPSVKTNVAATWARFGFQPTTEAERRARQTRPYHEETNEPEPGTAPATGPAADLRASARGDMKGTRLKLAVSR